jgi:multidrug efflux pump subunit AcrB
MFRSVRDSLVVVLTVPLALVGGIFGIRLLGVVTFQPLDLLTMIGFIMMIGIIVNHSILLVDRTRDALDHGHDLEEALRMALNQRLRAMVASTLTGALGALPMVLNPGPASVMYRGLAAVNVAGVIFSMVFSIVLLPALLRLMYRERDVARAPAQLGAAEPQAAGTAF